MSRGERLEVLVFTSLRRRHPRQELQLRSKFFINLTYTLACLYEPIRDRLYNEIP